MDLPVIIVLKEKKMLKYCVHSIWRTTTIVIVLCSSVYYL